MTTAHHDRSVLGAMYAGLGLAVVALIVPYADHATANVLAGHIRAGYPTYTQARIDSAVTTYLVYLSVVGALGIICWIWMIWAVKAGKRRGRDRAARARHSRRPFRSARQGHLRRHRPAAVAGLGRDAPGPGRAPGGHAAVEEIVMTGTAVNSTSAAGRANGIGVNGKEMTMEARIDYLGNPLALKLVKHINSAWAVLHDSAVPTATHVTHIFGKLGVANRTQAVIRARELGLLR